MVTQNKLWIGAALVVAVLAVIGLRVAGSSDEDTQAGSDTTETTIAQTSDDAELATTTTSESSTDSSSPSETTTTVTFADPTLAPNRDELSPGLLRASLVEPRLVVLEWSLVEGADSYQIYRDNLVAGTSTVGRYEDTTSPNHTYQYSVVAQFPDGVTAGSSIDVTTPPDTATDQSVKTVVQDAKSQARSLGLGPHSYWTVTPTCQACDFDSIAVSAGRKKPPTRSWNLPDGHPGIKNPESVHDFLLEAIAQGQAVTADFAESGVATQWTVDGFGMTSDCFMFDTAPPELVLAGKSSGDIQASSHCGYSG